MLKNRFRSSETARIWCAAKLFIIPCVDGCILMPTTHFLLLDIFKMIDKKRRQRRKLRKSKRTFLTKASEVSQILLNVVRSAYYFSELFQEHTRLAGYAVSLDLLVATVRSLFES